MIITIGFKNCYTHGRLKCDLLKEVNPTLVKKAKQASLFGNLILWSKSYFTSVAIQFEKKDKTLQNFPNVKFFHQAKEERKPERNLISDEVSILHLIAFNIRTYQVF